MELSASLLKKIIDFISSLPNIYSSEGQKAFTNHAGLDQKLQGQIPFGKPAIEFSSLLVRIVLDYGKLNDGREAIEAVLETAKDYIGQEKQIDCDTLLQEIQVYAARIPPREIRTLPKKSSLLMYTNRDGFQILMVQTFAERIEWDQPLYHCISPYRQLKRILKVFGNLKHPIPESEAANRIENAAITILNIAPDIIGFGGMGGTMIKLHQKLKERGFAGNIGYWGKDVGFDACTFLKAYGVTSEEEWCI